MKTRTYFSEEYIDRVREHADAALERLGYHMGIFAVVNTGMNLRHAQERAKFYVEFFDTPMPDGSRPTAYALAKAFDLTVNFPICIQQAYASEKRRRGVA